MAKTKNRKRNKPSDADAMWHAAQMDGAINDPREAFELGLMAGSTAVLQAMTHHGHLLLRTIASTLADQSTPKKRKRR
jgi:hypothetical protein